MRLKIAAIALLLLLLGAAGLYFLWPYLPYQGLAASQIARALRSYGLEVNSLRVEKLNDSEAVLQNLQFGDSLKIGRIEARYSLGEIRQGKLDALNLEQFSAKLYQAQGKWNIGGLEAFHSNAPENAPSPLFDGNALRALLPDQASVRQGNLTVSNSKGTAAIPFQFNLRKDPRIELELNTDPFTSESKPYAIQAGKGQATAVFDEAAQQWDAALRMHALTITGLSMPLPPLQMETEMTVGKEKAKGEIRLFDSEKRYRAELFFQAPTQQLKKGAIALRLLEFPWSGGMIGMEASSIPMEMNKPIALIVTLREIELAEILKEIGNDKVKATGKISGKIPLAYHPDGHITLEEGAAYAIQGGTIAIAPELLPGDSAQIKLARETLQNFHYTKLTLGIGPSATIKLAIEGKNPESLKGHPVNLHVNLTGDVLPLIQQSIAPINDLRQLIHAEENPQ